MVTESDKPDKRLEVSALKKLRVVAGLTQAELAQELGVSRKAVSYWETGRNEPQLYIWQFKALLKALNISVDELPDTFTSINKSANGQTATEG